MTAVDELLAFVRAALDEDERKIAAMEREQQRVRTAPIYQGYPPNWFAGVDIFVSPKRWRAEVEAKRRIIDVILAYEAEIDGEWGCCHNVKGIEEGRCPEIRPNEIHAIRLLAQPYAGQPGWREEWQA